MNDGERTAKRALIPPIQASRRKLRLRRGADFGTRAVSSPKVRPVVHRRATPRDKVASRYSRRGSLDAKCCGGGKRQMNTEETRKPHRSVPRARTREQQTSGLGSGSAGVAEATDCESPQVVLRTSLTATRWTTKRPRLGG